MQTSIESKIFGFCIIKHSPNWAHVMFKRMKIRETKNVDLFNNVNIIEPSECPLSNKILD